LWEPYAVSHTIHSLKLGDCGNPYYTLFIIIHSLDFLAVECVILNSITFYKFSNPLHKHMKKVLLAGGSVALIAMAALIGVNSEAAGTVVVRGIVKAGSEANNMQLFVTYVQTAPDADSLRGTTTEVDTGSAKKYAWTAQKGALKKVAIKSNPAVGQEVVVRGTIGDDNRITAAWVIQNYRQFTIEGVLEGRTINSGSSTSGSVTVHVSSAKMRNITPAKPFKETILKGTDVIIQVDGNTKVTADGKDKSFDEVSASRQKVRVEGQIVDGGTYTASKLTEL